LSSVKRLRGIGFFTHEAAIAKRPAIHSHAM
jgi:hypothetical protein